MRRLVCFGSLENKWMLSLGRFSSLAFTTGITSQVKFVFDIGVLACMKDGLVDVLPLGTSMANREKEVLLMPSLVTARQNGKQFIAFLIKL